MPEMSTIINTICYHLLLTTVRLLFAKHVTYVTDLESVDEYRAGVRGGHDVS